MAADKKKFVTLTSPLMVLKWPKLAEIDYGTKEYPNPDGSYSTKGVMRLDDPATQAFLEVLQPMFDNAEKAGRKQFAELKVETRKKLKEATANPLYTELFDEETEEPTGEIEFKFAMQASGTIKKGPREGKKWERKVALFDASGKPMKKVKSIWGGTSAKIAFCPSEYFIPGTAKYGVKLGLEAVQIIELVAAGSKSASAYGFGEEEGYAYEEEVDEDATTDSPFSASDDADRTTKADDGEGDF